MTIAINVMESVLGGTCGTCGAICIMDASSKNVGEVMLQALQLAAEKLSKDMSELVAGEDYEDAVLNYDHGHTAQPASVADSWTATDDYIF